MKVAIRETEDINEDQLRQLANLNDGKVSRRKAKREEARDYIWAHGRDWAASLSVAWEAEFGEEDDEDLLGLGLLSTEGADDEEEEDDLI